MNYKKVIGLLTYATESASNNGIAINQSGVTGVIAACSLYEWHPVNRIKATHGTCYLYLLKQVSTIKNAKRLLMSRNLSYYR